MVNSLLFKLDKVLILGQTHKELLKVIFSSSPSLKQLSPFEKKSLWHLRGCSDGNLLPMGHDTQHNDIEHEGLIYDTQPK